MDDSEKRFWTALEFRVCAELAGFAGPVRHFWCDGLIPDAYDLGADEPCIRGTAYCGPSGQQVWRFVLLTGPGIGSPAELDWTDLLPPGNATGWLSVHRDTQTLIMEPLAAYDD